MLSIAGLFSRSLSVHCAHLRPSYDDGYSVDHARPLYLCTLKKNVPMTMFQSSIHAFS